MRKYILITFLTLATLANAKAPRWAQRIPSAENETYRYVVEYADAMEQATALNMALGRVYHNVAMNLGLPVSTAQVENATRTGQLESLGREFQIPVNKVCDYTEKKSTGGVRVYVLCQVGYKSDRVQKPQFTEFRNCGNKGETDVEISGRPDDWDRFEGDSYFRAFLEYELDPDENEVDVQSKLTADVRKNLLTNLNLDEEDDEIAALIQTDQSYNKQKNSAYAVAYIDRNNVVSTYTAKVSKVLNRCNRFMKSIQSYIAEGNVNTANGYLKRVKNEVNKEINPRINFLRTYSSTDAVSNLIKEYNDLSEQIEDSEILLEGSADKNRAGKVQEYVNTAERALKERKLGDALRYYYAAQIFLKDLPDGNNISITPDNGKQENANIYIESRIKSILSDVHITFDGYLDDSKREAQLSFRYKGEAITNLDFRYNSNLGLTKESQSIRDGWSVIDIPVNNRPKSITVLLEYRYENEATSDVELYNIIKKYRQNYDKVATHDVEVKDVKMRYVTPTAQSGTGTAAGAGVKYTSTKASTDMCQNSVAERITEKKHKVTQVDSVHCMDVITKVCQAINSNRYKDVYPMFTANGRNQLDTLIGYGKAHVYSYEYCKFIRIGDEIMCRSIPMQFTFRKGKKTFENVVFTFDSVGLIDGIQFALEERSVRGIMAKKDFSETNKLMLINFMENYKTAFAMKRLNYINSIFADDAVIIVGRVLKRVNNNVDNIQQKINDGVEYTKYSKAEYMKRLAIQFGSKEWINLKFSKTKVEKTSQGEYYSIELLQDYMSDNYGDRGYLFLLIDCQNPDMPLIKVRTWQPEAAGGRSFTLSDYEKMLNK